MPFHHKIIKWEVERPFITLRNLYITFSKQAVKMLEMSPYVHMLVDDKKRIAAFQVSGNDVAAIPFYSEDKAATRIMAKKYSSILMGLAKVNDCGKGIRFYGDYLAEDKAIVFDFSMPVFSSKSATPSRSESKSLLSENAENAENADKESGNDTEQLKNEEKYDKL